MVCSEPNQCGSWFSQADRFSGAPGAGRAVTRTVVEICACYAVVQVMRVRTMAMVVFTAPVAVTV